MKYTQTILAPQLKLLFAILLIFGAIVLGRCCYDYSQQDPPITMELIFEKVERGELNRTDNAD